LKLTPALEGVLIAITGTPFRAWLMVGRLLNVVSGTISACATGTPLSTNITVTAQRATRTRDAKLFPQRLIRQSSQKVRSIKNHVRL
jgi:hypothetical protein